MQDMHFADTDMLMMQARNAKVWPCERFGGNQILTKIQCLTDAGRNQFGRPGVYVDVEKELTLALLKMADRIAAESKGAYYPVEFRNAVETQGGLAVAKERINQPISEGFMRLVKLQRVDLSLEAVILSSPQFHALFTPAELAICRYRTTKL